MIAIIGIVLKIAAYMVPWIIDSFSPKNKVRRQNEAFDKAIVRSVEGGGVDDLSVLLSQRIDRLSQ